LKIQRHGLARELQIASVKSFRVSFPVSVKAFRFDSSQTTYPFKGVAMRSSSHLVASLFAIVLALSTFARTQSSTSLHGTIFDVKGAVVSDASVTLSNPATAFSRTTKSDQQGVYQFLQVPPSTYTLSVTARGFAPINQGNVILQVSSPATLDFTLQVQGSAVMVEVTGAATTVNTEDASQGHVFNANQLIALPAEGRDPVAILSLQPGVTYLGSQTPDQQDQDSRGDQ